MPTSMNISITYLRLRKNGKSQIQRQMTTRYSAMPMVKLYHHIFVCTCKSYEIGTIALSYFSTYKLCMFGYKWIPEFLRWTTVIYCLIVVCSQFMCIHTQLSTKLLNCNRQKFRRCEKFMMHHIDDDDDDDKTTTIHESYDEMMNIISEVGWIKIWFSD